MNAFERRQKVRKQKQGELNLHRKMDRLVKHHGIILRFEKAYQNLFNVIPKVEYNNGRYYVGIHSYQEQAMLHKIRDGSVTS